MVVHLGQPPSRGARLAGVVLGLAVLVTAACTPDGPRSSVETIRAYITGYSYFDNTPPGSGRISNPVLHATAGGTGTHDDPVTVAVGHVVEGGQDILDWPAGTRFYAPNLRKYLIVEDACGDGDAPQNGPCHVGAPDDAETWLDIWIGGEGGTEQGARNCMDAISGVWDVVVDPQPGLAVEPGEVYGSAGCAHSYGDDIVVAD